MPAGGFASLVRVLASQGNRSESTGLCCASSPRYRVFSKVLLQQVSQRLPPSTRVVNGPPPLRLVRYPLPPAGAFICIVISAITEQWGQRKSQRPRFTKWSLLWSSDWSPGESISKADMGNSLSNSFGEKSCINAFSPSNSNANPTASNRAFNSSLVGGCSRQSHHSSSVLGVQVVCKSPIRNCTKAPSKSGRGEATAMIGLFPVPTWSVI